MDIISEFKGMNKVMLQTELRLDMLRKQRRTMRKELTRLEIEECKNNEAHGLISSAMQLMYSNLSSKLGNIITEGLQCIFPDGGFSKFEVRFVPRRDTIEADLIIIADDGAEYHPVDAVGGGVADFIGLMLRITYIYLSKNRNVLFADEPLKFIDRSRIPDAAEFIKKICKDLDFKLVIVTHIPEYMEMADTIYKVQKRKGISVVSKLK